MPYSEELKKTIEQSNITHKRIVEELEKRNLHIDKSYLSKLINGKLPAPREEISRAIAQICNIDERILVIEGYYDKAPKEIKEILFYLQKLTFMSTISAFSNIDNIKQEDIPIIEENLKQQSMGEFLTELLDFNKEDNFTIINGNFIIDSKKENIKFQLEEPISLLIKNDDMFPIIPENSKVTIEAQKKYQNGDIIALKYKNEIIARYYFENNGIISFSSLNKKSETINNNAKDLKILGKITKVIYNIQ